MQQIGRPPERKRIPVVLTVQEVQTLLSLLAARPAGWMRWYLRTDGQVFGTWGMDCNGSILALHISFWLCHLFVVMEFLRCAAHQALARVSGEYAEALLSEGANTFR